VWLRRDRPTTPALLGDIVISVDAARRQARHGMYRELLHLAHAE